MGLIFLLFLALFITFLSSKIFISFFQDKNKIINKEMFKLVGNSGTTITNVSNLFGVVSCIDDFGKEKNIVCYSYRENIKKDLRILITDYDSNKEMYVVDEYPK